MIEVSGSATAMTSSPAAGVAGADPRLMRLKILPHAETQGMRVFRSRGTLDSVPLFRQRLMPCRRQPDMLEAQSPESYRQASRGHRGPSRETARRGPTMSDGREQTS